MCIGLYCMIMTVFNILSNISAAYQDHVVQWDPSNQIFKQQNNVIHVHEGDNLIFTCAKNPTHRLQLFWTTIPDVYNTCDKLEKQQFQKLFECKEGQSNIDFILKVSQFSELAGAPHFLPGKPVLFIAQQPWCFKHNIKLATIRENDRHMFIFKNNSITNISKPSKSQIIDTEGVRSGIENSRTAINRNRNPGTETSDWKNYRFLLLPGSLALLTLVGMQIVVCTFWLPKSIKRYFTSCGRRRCSRHCQPEETAIVKRSKTEGTTKIHSNRLLNSSFASRCASASRYVLSNYEVVENGEQANSLLNVPNCCLLNTQQLCQSHKLNGFISKSRGLNALPDQPTTGIGDSAAISLSNACTNFTPDSHSQLVYATGPSNETFVYYNVNPTIHQTLWIPYTEAVVKSGSTKSSEKPTIRFAVNS